MMFFKKAALNTLKSGWFELKLAKLFGKKSVYHDGNVFLQLNEWHGKVYLITTWEGDFSE